MTVPQDTALCFGLGMAAHLAYTTGPRLDPAATKRVVGAFAAGWVPLTSVLLIGWPEWSWWYWEALAGRTDLAFALGLLLEVAAFVFGLSLSARLSRSQRLKSLAVLGFIYLFLLALPWPYYSRVGSADEVAAGQAPWLWQAPDLLAVIVLGGAWLIGICGWTAYSIHRQGDGSSKGLSDAELSVKAPEDP